MKKHSLTPILIFAVCITTIISCKKEIISQDTSSFELNKNRLVFSESQFIETLNKIKQENKLNTQKNYLSEYKNFSSLSNFEKKQ